MMPSEDAPDHVPDDADTETPDADTAATAASGDLDSEDAARPGISAVVWIPVLSAAVIAGLLVVGWQSLAL